VPTAWQETWKSNHTTRSNGLSYAHVIWPIQQCGEQEVVSQSFGAPSSEDSDDLATVATGLDRLRV